MNLYSNLKDDFSTAVLGSGCKANFIVLFFLRAREEPLLMLITHAAHSFIEFIHCLSIKCTQFLFPLQSTCLHSNAAERPGGTKQTD